MDCSSKEECRLRPIHHRVSILGPYDYGSNDLLAGLRVAATESGRQEPLMLGFTADISGETSVQAMHNALSQSFNNRLDNSINTQAT